MPDNPFRLEIDASKPNPFRQAQEQPPAAPPQTLASYGTGLARSVTQGVTFGFGDEAEAAIKALISQQPGEDYADAYARHRDAIRQQMGQFSEQNPGSALAGEIGGALVPGLGTAGMVGRFIAGGARTATRLGRATTVGASEGAIYGAGTAEEMEDVPGGMASGAALGGALGAAVPAAIQTAKGLRSLARGATSPQFGADVRIGQAIARDGMTPGDVAGRLDEARRLGRPATIADVGGENVLRELEVATQRPGAGADRAVQFLSARNRDQLDRLSRDLVRGTGAKGDDVVQAIQTTMKARADAAAPVYAKAMQFQAELNDDIVDAYNRVLKTPLGKQALPKARRILNVENFDDAPLMERVDALKRGVDDIIEGAKRKGEGQIARSATKLKRDLVDAADAANPAYQQAREIWEDGSSYLDAIEAGRSIMNNKVTASQLRLDWSKLGNAEREAYRIGAVDSIITKMRQNSAQEPNLLKALRSPEVRDKLAVLMTPQQAARFDRILDIEESMFRTSTQARGNSATARRLAAMAEQEKQTRLFGAIGMLLDMITSPVRSIFTRGIPAMTAAGREMVLSRQNRIIVDRLLSQRPDAMNPVAALNIVNAPPPSFAGRAQVGSIPASIAATSSEQGQ